MTKPTTAERIEWLLSPERRERLDVPRILSLLSLRPYFTVADVGCGPGLFAIPLAKSLWNGKVYAVDVEEDMLEVTRSSALKARLGNITTLKSDGSKLPLEPGSLDGALLACVLNEVADKGALLKDVVDAMKRDGWCAIIEWRKAIDGREGPPPKHRIAEKDMMQLAKAAGLRLSMRRELNSYQFLLVLIK